MKVNFKLEASSNKDPNVNGMDKGLNQRGRVFSYESRFVENDDEVDGARHIYKQDTSISDLMHHTGYRLALFHTLAPYAKQFYEKGLLLPAECKVGFEDAVADSDTWAGFFEDCVQRNEGSLVWKDDVLEIAAQYRDQEQLPDWKDVKQEFQKRGFVYNSQHRETVDGQRRKGFVSGCTVRLPSDKAGLN